MKVRLLIFLVTVAAMTACNNAEHGAGSSMDNTGDRQEKDSPNVPNHVSAVPPTPPPATGNDTVALDEKSSDFVKEAASGGMMEVALGQIAGRQAMDAAVKQFGAMMVEDHSKANAELKVITGAKHFALPASMMDKHQQHVDHLGKMKDKDFDRAYTKMMVDDHQEDIRKFEQAAQSSTDTTVRSFARRTLPVLKKHLSAAQAIYRAQQ